MENKLKEILSRNGVSASAVAILEEQKLTSCDVLKEADVQVLILCGIKAGDALVIKRTIANLDLLESNKVDEEIEILSVPATNPVDVFPNENCNKEIQEPKPHEEDKLPSPFQYEEKTNRMYFNDFKLLEKFSPTVTAALEANTLTGTLRKEFVRDICTNIQSHGIYFLSKEQRNQVALAIITKYPHLKDAIGSGLGSWSESIRNRFKYVRKYENKKRKASADPCHSNTETRLPEQPKTKIPRRLDFWNVVPLAENTTPAIHEEHLVELAKETSKQANSQDKAKIKALMDATYEMRRKNILSTAIPVRDIIEKYPALATMSGIRNEFCRVMNDGNAIKDMKCKFSEYKGAIIEHSKLQQRKTQIIKNVLREFAHAISEEPDEKQNFESTCAILLLTKLLQKKSSRGRDLVELLCEDDDVMAEIKAVTYPRLVTIGENLMKLDRVLICVEGQQLLDASSYPLETVFFCLHALYYIFSIEYPSDHKDVFLFIDSVLMGLQTAASRILLQNFIKAAQTFLEK